MSNLMGMMNTGVSGIFAAQVGLDVTGHNIKNAKTPGFSRQTVSFVTNKPQYTYVGNLGTGVKVEAISRSYDSYLGKSLRNEASSYSYFNTMQTGIKDSMLYFNELTEGSGLGDSLKSYFNAWQSLASSAPDKTDEAAIKRITLIETTKTLTSKIREGYQSLEEVKQTSDSKIKESVASINQISRNLADMNKLISQAEAGGSQANDLRDTRDKLLDNLSELTNMSTYERPNGEIAVFIGGQVIVDSNQSHQLEVKENPDNAHHYDVYWKTDYANSKPVNISDKMTGGAIGAEIKMRDDVINGYQKELDQLAKSIITETNRLHSSGQGLETFTDVTGSNGVENTKYAFNTEAGKLPYPVKDGTFRITLHNSAGEAEHFDIQVNSGDNLESIKEKIASADGSYVGGGGKLNAYIGENNNLQISAGDGYTMSFGDDTSDFLMAAGINTFFSGSGAKDIGINQIIEDNPKYIATGRSGADGDNANASAIAKLQTKGVVGSTSVTIGEFYGSFIGKIASDKNQADIFAATKKMSFSQINTRLESIRGVNMDEELINMSMYQRSFEASSRFINIVDEMLNKIINGLGTGGR